MISIYSQECLWSVCRTHWRTFRDQKHHLEHCSSAQHAHVQDSQARVNNLGQYFRPNTFQKVEIVVDLILQIYYIYSQNGGSQSMSRRFERQKLAAGEKFGAIKSLADPDHKYVSFIVCRDPIEKLLSVYNFMKYQVLENERNQKKKNPPEWQKYFSSRNIPSWKMFLFKLSKGFTGYDGLTDSLINKCSPCHYHYR